MLAASHVLVPDGVLVALIPIAAGVAGWLIRYVTQLRKLATVVTGEDRAEAVKDQLIATLEQNHEALVERVRLVEERADDLDRKLTDERKRADTLADQVRDGERRYAALETYAAPEAVKRLQTMFTSHVDLLENVLDRMTGIEGQLAEGIGQLTEAVNSLTRR